MSRAVGVSSYIADLIVATSLLTMLLAGLAVRYRIVFSRPAPASPPGFGGAARRAGSRKAPAAGGSRPAPGTPHPPRRRLKPSG
jgi:hypothetical protein